MSSSNRAMYPVRDADREGVPKKTVQNMDNTCPCGVKCCYESIRGEGMDKLREYQQLVSEVKDYVLLAHGGRQPFQGYSSCDAVNLWTFWQGRSVMADGTVCHHLSARILLVGRDWGDVEKNSACIESIQALQEGHSQRYVTKKIYDGTKMSNPTDERVRRLFAVLGYDVTASAQDDSKNQDLFFTNIFPCFRSGGNTGKLLRKSPALEREYFRRLVELLQPEAVLCLGKDAYQEVRRALGSPVQGKELKPYGRYVERDCGVPVDVGGMHTMMFALAHPGPLGTIDRVREAKDRTAQAGEEAQFKDWKKIKVYLDSLPVSEGATAILEVGGT